MQSNGLRGDSTRHFSGRRISVIILKLSQKCVTFCYRCRHNSFILSKLRTHLTLLKFRLQRFKSDSIPPLTRRYSLALGLFEPNHCK
jgi:hypothetical protein